jgi:methylase of polypeptide subunit release factors
MRPTPEELDASLHAALQEEAELERANETVRLLVTSFHDVTFKVEVDTLIPRQEWNELSELHQDEAIRDAVFEQSVVEVRVLD